MIGLFGDADSVPMFGGSQLLDDGLTGSWRPGKNSRRIAEITGQGRKRYGVREQGLLSAE